MKSRPVRAPRGTQLSAKSWLTEAPLRMLMNNLDPEVAERPEDLVVYGGIGKAARNWNATTRSSAPYASSRATNRFSCSRGSRSACSGPTRMRRASSSPTRTSCRTGPTGSTSTSSIVRGLMMYGQMTAGSWIYIGSQGIVQGTYETFAEAGRRHYNGDWAGQWILTAGLGGMGGAQPLAATMAGASMLAIECDPARIEMRLKSGYLDKKAANLDEAMAILGAASAPVSVAVLGNAAELVPQIAQKARSSRFRPALVTDQTSAHDPANGYLPEHWSLEKWKDLRKREPDEVAMSARESIANHVQAILQFKAMGIPCVDYGNNIRQEAKNAALKNAFDFPGVRSSLHPADVLRRQGTVPLGCALRRSARHREHRCEGARAFPGGQRAATLARSRRKENQFQGLPAHLLARPRAAPRRWARLQRDGALGRAQGPIVIDATTSMPARWRARTARPNRCATAPTPCPTGRSSTSCSIPRPAQPGFRSTMAAASAWATRSTPAW